MDKIDLYKLVGDEKNEAKLWLEGFFNELRCLVNLSNYFPNGVGNFKDLIEEIYLLDTCNYVPKKHLPIYIEKPMKHDPKYFWVYVEKYNKELLPAFLVSGVFVTYMPF